MEINQILNHLDLLFSKQDLQTVEPFLTEQLDLAFENKEYNTCITIMNELIGFFRDTSQYQKSLDYCEQVLRLMQQMGLEDTLPYATTCLNVANALRAAGLHKESLAFFEKVFPIYQDQLDANDERVASLYNNLSLLYQEMGDFESAVACLKQALAIVVNNQDTLKIAITHSNLGASLLQLNLTEQAMFHLEQAMAIFNQDKEKDFHYNAAVAALGQVYAAQGKLSDARECFQEALFEQQKHCGKSEAFYRILENLHTVEKAMGLELTLEPEDLFVSSAITSLGKSQSSPDTTKSLHMLGLDLAEEFYEQIAKPSLLQQFPAFINRMAIGLVGEGSECFGYDDEISADHDFGPGFCIWLTREDYQYFGKELQQWYQNLPAEYKGYSRHDKHTAIGSGRVGVWCMDDFFKHFIGYSDPIQISSEDSLLNITEESMAAVLNGRIFHDPSGIFSKKRLAFYNLFTEKIWNTKLANSLIMLGKYGQYNYPRAMKRGDYVTAQMILYKYIEELLKFVHYMNHVFPPYYKWLKKSASSLNILAVLADLTDALADFAPEGRGAWRNDPSGASDKIVGTMEIIAKLIVEECRKHGLFDGLNLPAEELFLETYGKALFLKILVNNDVEEAKGRSLSPLSDEINLNNNTKEELVEHMVSLEWQAFDEVQNQGGRADCQDDWGTFSIMRKSQYMAWPKELIICYIKDFQEANAKHWNLITEKYGRMMKTTDPKSYSEISARLPVLTRQQEIIIEQIVALQVSWMEKFAVEYPNMAYNSRSIHTSEDSLFNTSYETYLRGELSTYSHETLKMYGNFVVQLARNNQNLTEMIMTNTALLYGYKSLEDAEQRLAQS